MNNVRRALAQTSVSTASTLHPSMLAARPSFTLLQWAPTFQKHHQRRDYFWKQDTTTNAIGHLTTPSIKIHKHTTVASHFSTLVSALLFWSLVSFCLWVYWHHKSHSWKSSDSAFPPSQCTRTNSHFRPHCSRVKCHLTTLSIHCLLFFPLSLVFAAIFNGINTKVFMHASQISAQSLQLYFTITISFTSVLQYIIWCLHCPRVPLCSNYLPVIGCNSAAQRQANSLIM